jgi:hypothetical protein
MINKGDDQTFSHFYLFFEISNDCELNIRENQRH